MTTGPCLQFDDQSAALVPGSVCPETPLHVQSEAPMLDLAAFMFQIELQPPSTLAGMAELMGNECYRRGLFTEGNELKDVAQRLRGK